MLVSILKGIHSIAFFLPIDILTKEFVTISILKSALAIRFVILELACLFVPSCFEVVFCGGDRCSIEIPCESVFVHESEGSIAVSFVVFVESCEGGAIWVEFLSFSMLFVEFEVAFEDDSLTIFFTELAWAVTESVLPLSGELGLRFSVYEETIAMEHVIYVVAPENVTVSVGCGSQAVLLAL